MALTPQDFVIKWKRVMAREKQTCQEQRRADSWTSMKGIFVMSILCLREMDL